MKVQLGWLYDVAVPHDVRDFLVTDKVLLAALTAGAPGRAADEQLIVVENEGTVDMALYLDRDVLERLAVADPRRGISRVVRSERRFGRAVGSETRAFICSAFTTALPAAALAKLT